MAGPFSSNGTTAVTPPVMRINGGQEADRIYHMDSSATDTNCSPANTIRKGVLVYCVYTSSRRVLPYTIAAMALGYAIAGITMDDVKTVDVDGTAAHNPVTVMTNGIVEAKDVWYETSTSGTMAKLSTLTGRPLFIIMNALACNHPYVIGSPMGASLYPVKPDYIKDGVGAPGTGYTAHCFSPSWMVSPLLEPGVQIFVRI